MHLVFNDVNDAFENLIQSIADENLPTVRTPSRVGDVLQIPEPLTVTYRNPLDRVLFNRYRDANPFFHLYESLWMLAGRNDITPLAYYSSGYEAQVKDGDDPNANGAYGYRWRNYDRKTKTCEECQGGIGRSCPKCSGIGSYWTSTDQLDILVGHLQENPNSRRAVLSMWNVKDDLLKIGSPVGYSKDVCCNTQAYFSLREGVEFQDYDRGDGYFVDYEYPSKFLDMTVTNRSNDIVWGMLGANYVHFSFLQEYLADRLGVSVGLYHQFTNNAHVYTERFKPDLWLKEYGVTEGMTQFDPPPRVDLYKDLEFPRISLAEDYELFDKEVNQFVEDHKSPNSPSPTGFSYDSRFLRSVASPACHAFHFHKERDYEESLKWANRIEATDWRIACTEWLERRERKYNAKKG